MRPSECWKLEWMHRSQPRRRAKDWRVWLLMSPGVEALLKLVNLLVKLGHETQILPQKQL